MTAAIQSGVCHKPLLEYIAAPNDQYIIHLQLCFHSPSRDPDTLIKAVCLSNSVLASRKSILVVLLMACIYQ